MPLRKTVYGKMQRNRPEAISAAWTSRNHRSRHAKIFRGKYWHVAVPVDGHGFGVIWLGLISSLAFGIVR